MGKGSDNHHHTLKSIPIDAIDPDPDNPNMMSDKQMEALELSIKKHGFAKDIWVNDTGRGRYRVIDGHHRLIIMKKLGRKAIKCRVFKMDDTRVRILRQVGNNLTGVHNHTKDAEEIRKIIDSMGLESLSEITGKSEYHYRKLISGAIDDAEKQYNEDFAKANTGSRKNISDKNEKTEYPQQKSEPRKRTIDHYCIVPGCTHGRDISE